jgi:Holliday junction resolvase-like predicted endonuclease
VRAAAAQFLATSPVRPVQIRFDVVGVLDGELTVYQGAF